MKTINYRHGSRLIQRTENGWLWVSDGPEPGDVLIGEARQQGNLLILLPWKVRDSGTIPALDELPECPLKCLLRSEIRITNGVATCSTCGTRLAPNDEGDDEMPLWTI